MTSVTKYALLSAALVSSSFTLAHEAGDMFIRGGLVNAMPNESSDEVPGTGLGLKVDNDLQIGVNATYMYSDNIGFELLAATPFTHEVTLGGSKVAEVSHLPPSLMAQYYFGQSDSAVRPYAGAGVNYTVFFDEKTFGALDGTEVSLDNSFGLAAQAGVDVTINKNWFANASIWYIDINTTVDTALGPVDLDIDPYVFMASVGYTF